MGKIKVLVVDDNPVIIRMNEGLLTAHGYEVITATDGASGIAKAKAQHPDVILLDIILPVMHGFEVCQSLKKDPSTQDIPVILITGTGLEEIASSEPEINAQGFLAKPYTFEAVDALIQKVLKK